jgi:hypothetical protein
MTGASDDLGREVDVEAGQPGTVDRFLLGCGLAGLAVIVLFAVSNFALGDWAPPEPSASPAEISRFFLVNGPRLEWAVGMRYLVFFLLPIFLYGVSLWVRGAEPVARSLSRIALIGTAWLVAAGSVANTLESMLIYARGDLVSEPQLAHVSALGMNALFGIAVVPHALIIGGLSEAGRRTKTLPLPLVILGYFQAVTGLIGGAALGRALEHGWFFNLSFGLSFFAFALWYLGAALVLVLGASKRIRARQNAHRLDARPSAAR